MDQPGKPAAPPKPVAAWRTGHGLRHGLFEGAAVVKVRLWGGFFRFRVAEFSFGAWLRR
jgi:hypothetical protein